MIRRFKVGDHVSWDSEDHVAMHKGSALQRLRG